MASNSRSLRAGVRRIVGREVVERDHRHYRAQAGEVGVDLDALDVADDEERRVAQVVLVAHQLDVGGPQVLVPALVLPGEEVPLPGVGEAVAAGGLGDALLEGVLGADRVGLVGRRLAEHPAEVDEVLLGGGLLRRGHAAPLGRERARRQGRLGRHAPLPRSSTGWPTHGRVYGGGSARDGRGAHSRARHSAARTFVSPWQWEADTESGHTSTRAARRSFSSAKRRAKGCVSLGEAFLPTLLARGSSERGDEWTCIALTSILTIWARS
jgi:hypothetical protein